jgi:hypothetical protein
MYVLLETARHVTAPQVIPTEEHRAVQSAVLPDWRPNLRSPSFHCYLTILFVLFSFNFLVTGRFCYIIIYLVTNILQVTSLYRKSFLQSRGFCALCLLRMSAPIVNLWIQFLAVLPVRKLISGDGRSAGRSVYRLYAVQDTGCFKYVFSDTIRTTQRRHPVSTAALLVVGGDEKEMNPVPGGVTGPRCHWGTRDVILKVGGLDARLTTLLCKKNYFYEIQRNENRMQLHRIF